MNSKVICPYCGNEMWYPDKPWERSQPEMGGYMYKMHGKCRHCEAMTPAAYGRTPEEAVNAFFASALRRYEPPTRPLTREEVKPVVLKIDEWVEFSNGYVRHIIPDVIDGEYLWDKNDCYYDLRTYGTDWRLWPRRPTEQERQAAGWEDEKE